MTGTQMYGIYFLVALALTVWACFVFYLNNKKDKEDKRHKLNGK